MEPLTWTGSLSFLNPIFLGLWAVLGVAVIAQVVTSLFAGGTEMQGNTLAATRSPADYASLAVKGSFGLIVLVIGLHIWTLIKEHRAREAEADHDMHDSQQR